MLSQLKNALVQINDPDGNTQGTGFVIMADGLIATCAHVIDYAQSGPGQTVNLRFHLTKTDATACVEPDGWRSPTAEDVAILRVLNDSLPDGVVPLPLGSAQASQDHPFRSYGYPKLSKAKETHVRGMIEGLINDNQLLQISSGQVTRGISGGPVFDTLHQCVVGIISEFPSWTDKFKTAVGTQKRSDIAGDPHGRHTETNYATPTEVLLEIWPGLPLIEIPTEATKLATYQSRLLRQTQYLNLRGLSLPFEIENVPLDKL